MRKTILLVVITITFLTSENTSAQWSTATMSSSRSLLAAASAGHNAIIAGGIGLTIS